MAKKSVGCAPDALILRGRIASRLGSIVTFLIVFSAAGSFATENLTLQDQLARAWLKNQQAQTKYYEKESARKSFWKADFKDFLPAVTTFAVFILGGVFLPRLLEYQRCRAFLDLIHRELTKMAPDYDEKESISPYWSRYLKQRFIHEAIFATPSENREFILSLPSDLAYNMAQLWIHFDKAQKATDSASLSKEGDRWCKNLKSVCIFFDNRQDKSFFWRFFHRDADCTARQTSGQVAQCIEGGRAARVDAIAEAIIQGKLADERMVMAYQTLGWTDAQKREVDKLKPGHVLELTRGKDKGAAWHVESVNNGHVYARNTEGQVRQFDKRHAKSFDVCKKIGIGDNLLSRSGSVETCKQQKVKLYDTIYIPWVTLIAIVAQRSELTNFPAAEPLSPQDQLAQAQLKNAQAQAKYYEREIRRPLAAARS
jgi:hypothetical protein